MAKTRPAVLLWSQADQQCLWRAHNERSSDLRFSQEETSAFFQQTLPVPLAPNHTISLEKNERCAMTRSLVF